MLFSSLGLVPRGRGSWRVRSRWLLLPLRVIAATALIIALAAPSVVQAAFDVPAEGIDIVIVVDPSSSMTTADLDGQPRIEVVKKVVHDFLGGLKNDRVGIVIFSAESMVLSPLTLDYAAAQRLVEPVAAGRPLRDGTAIGTGLSTGLNVVRESTARGKVAILLTDGQNNSGDVQPIDAAQIAKLIGIRLYTIGAVAARSRAEVDEALMKRMAEMTGGLYFRAPDETALRDVYREIQTLEKARVGTRAFISTEDASLPFAAAGAGLLALQLLLALTVFRRTP
jgi:Ca-activated chloride channel family protein